MTVGRRYTQSSVSRFYLKIYSRFTALTLPATVSKLSNVNGADLAPVSIGAYNATTNWVNGFVRFSDLRYRILSMVERHGIPRSLSYIFMSCGQYGYKHLVLKKDTTPDEVVDRCVKMTLGSPGQEAPWGDKVDDVLASIADIMEYLGYPSTITTPVGSATSSGAT